MTSLQTLDEILESVRAGTLSPCELDVTHVACTEDDLLGAIDSANERVDDDLAASLVETELLLAIADARGDARPKARARRARAHALNYANRFDDAEKTAREGLALASCDADEAGLRMTLVHTLARVSRLDEALEEAVAARTLLERAGEHAQAARARINEGILLRMRGDLRGAIDTLRLALDHPGHDAVTRAHISNNLAEVLLELGRFGEAEGMFAAAAEGFSAAGKSRLGAIARGNLADLLGRQGRLAEAAAQFEHARRYFEADKAEAELGRVLTEQADVLRAMGLNDEACAKYRAASRTLDRAGMKGELARALKGEAATLIQSDPDGAEGPLLRARGLYDELGNAAERAGTDLVRARLELARGAPERGREVLALARLDLGERQADLRACTVLEAECLLAAGCAQDALRLVRTVDYSDDGTGDRSPDVHFIAGRAALTAGDHAAALRHLRRCRAAIERGRAMMGSARHREGALASRRAVYDTLIDALLAFPTPAAIDEALETAEAARGLSYLEQLSAAGVAGPENANAEEDGLDAWTHARQRVRYLYSQPSPEQGAAPDENSKRSIAQAERELADLEARIASTRVGTMLQIASPQSGEIKRSLAQGEAVLSYWASRGSLVCFVITRSSTHAIRLDASVEDADAIVEHALFQIRRGLARAGGAGPRRIAATEDALRDAGRIVLDPVLAAGLLDGCGDITVVPTGALHALPIGALRDEHGYLAERAGVAVIPSAVLLPSVRSLRGSSGGLCVLGVPDRAAPRIEDEAAAVASLACAESLAVGEQATWEELRHAGSHASVLHLACHGVHLPDGPTASALKLADRWVTGRDVMSLRLPGSTVVLSGCDTGRLSPTFGEEVHGLARCFFVAGARGLITSLWPAHDDSTCRFMERLYRTATEHASKTPRIDAHTLARAQREEISTGTHPALWANFAYVGG